MVLYDRNKAGHFCPVMFLCPPFREDKTDSVKNEVSLFLLNSIRYTALGNSFHMDEKYIAAGIRFGAALQPVTGDAYRNLVALFVPIRPCQ